MTRASDKLATLGLTLPPPRVPVGTFLLAARHGDLVILSGQGPVTADGTRMTGKVGEDVSVEAARDHARLVTMNLLSAAAAQLGSIDRIKRIVSVLGLVNAAPDFVRHGDVIDGCSDLLAQIFGPEHGSHARTDLGAQSLPGGITVEIEMVLCAGGAT